MRRPIPKWIENSPELYPWLFFYLVAFLDLSTERTHAMGLTPIPWSRIKEYSEFHFLGEEQSERLFFFIREMDNANIKRLESAKPKKPKT